MFLSRSAKKYMSWARNIGKIPRTTRRANSNTSGAMTQEATAQTTITESKKANGVVFQIIKKINECEQLTVGRCITFMLLTYVGVNYINMMKFVGNDDNGPDAYGLTASDREEIWLGWRQRPESMVRK
jgi:hypothetical protein